MSKLHKILMRADMQKRESYELWEDITKRIKLGISRYLENKL